MTLRVVTPPGDEDLIVSLERANEQVAADGPALDSTVLGHIRAAGRIVEADTQRRYLPQDLEWVLTAWRSCLRLPVAAGDGGALTVTGIAYADAMGQAQTLDPLTYWVRPDGPTFQIVPRQGVVWPVLGDAAEPIVVSLAVEAAESGPPENVVAAALLIVGDLVKNREGGQLSGGLVRPGSAADSLLSFERWS